MKKTSTKTIGLCLLILGSIFASGTIFSMVVQAEEEKDTPVTIPNDAAGIWQAVDTETNEMSKLIQAGTVSDLHHHAFAVRDLVAALPAHSASLPADKLEKVQSASKFVAILAQRLDAAGDSNDKDAASSNFEKLNVILKSIRGNYSDANLK
jgi:CRISPR/Cas system CSM-associated protein Csm2 small subunit